MSPNRKYVLNSLVSYLKQNKLLPALCFIFSRKQVEVAARDITISLHDDNGLMASTVEQECRNILMSKLPNYKEYIELPEYKNMISLLQKGVAIHHAGIITVLREMIEILFDKGYIKLLFATETFAVGINMPTKTVIFTSLEKYDGSRMRYLLPHEYSQMAGRAGRRGIDTRGTVIHCNALFDMPTITDYRHILTGPSQTITSSFRVSYNFVLNVLLPEKITNDRVTAFISNSLLSSDIEKEVVSLDIKSRDLQKTLENYEETLISLRTPNDISIKYIELTNQIKTAVNKTKKRLAKEIYSIEQEYPTIETDSQQVVYIQNLSREIDNINSYKLSTSKYISQCVNNITSLLSKTGFVNIDDDNVITVTATGAVASQIQEVNALALSMVMTTTECFSNLSSIEIAGLLASLVFVNVVEDKKILKPSTLSDNLNCTTIELENTLNKLESIEMELQIDSGENYIIQFDLQQTIMDWYDSSNESECRNILTKINSRGISTGDFVKAALKITNAVREIKDASDMLNYHDLSEKLAAIPENILKYVVTNQSLYL